MAKPKSVYACQNCGHQSPKWVGRCPSCSAWNTLVEEIVAQSAAARSGSEFYTLSSEKPVPLGEMTREPVQRLVSRNREFDRVLGDGFVPGSLVLVGGDPGIGKSTLILQAMEQLASAGHTVLYVSGEESADQIKMRADRLGAVAKSLYVMTENNLDKILTQAKTLNPALVVVDSIQTVYLPHLESAPGSVAQVRECAGKLLYFSKSLGITSVLIGHVTKEGTLAGPRMLEHMVDTVLYFEGDKGHAYRILRTIKNRYGSTNEIGVFEMSDKGLLPVDNPSQIFLSERPDRPIGSVVMAAMEGTRPLLVEIQALAAGSGLVNPRRTAIGIDPNRLALLVAVLEKLVGLNLYTQDIYVNVAGGLKVTEPAVDLAVLAALVSSFKNVPINAKTIVFGEVGLSGEVRSVGNIDARLKEAQKLGFKRCILPSIKGPLPAPAGLELIPINRVGQALEQIF